MDPDFIILRDSVYGIDIYRRAGIGSMTSYTKKGLTSGKTYYYKIKAYKKSGSKKKMGAASSALKVKVK